MAQVALAWILSKEGVSAPIVATTSIENMMEAIGQRSQRGDSRRLMIDHYIDAIQVRLSDEEVKCLEELYTPQPVYGHL